MLFDSLAYVVFFPLFAVLFLNATARIQPLVLLAGSLLACASFGWVSLAWALSITVLGFVLGRRMAEAGSTAVLVAALVAVVSPLLILKYTNFAADSLQSGMSWFGIGVAFPHLQASLPVGISFYTFVVLGYLIDIHLGRIGAERDPTRFALLTTFYPKFVAGPVERASAFLPQVDPPKRFDYDRVTAGLRIIGSGMLKKLVVSDRLGVVVDGVYADPGAYGGVALVFTSICYMFQLYYDFSGYSEIAVGSARVLGYNLVWNFNRPYAARSISDYWRRWHISLTTWFFQYIYFPMSASLRRWKRTAVIVPMMSTFLISGLWHGARWTFVLYGAVHGVAMCVDYLSAKPRKLLRQFAPARLYAVVAWALTFALVACADVVFRSNSIGAAGTYFHNEGVQLPADLAFLFAHRFSASALKSLIAGLPILKTDLVIAVAVLVCVELVSLRAKAQTFGAHFATRPLWMRWSAYYLVAGAILYLGSQNSATLFIYEQF